MISYVLVLLVVNSYSRSFGIPVKPTLSSSQLLYQAFDSLANRCASPFLSSQIKDQMKECISGSENNDQRKFECIMFYDINTQLCDALTRLTLTENSTAKIASESLDVAKLCEQAPYWNVSDIKEFPDYKITVEKALKTEALCVNFCGSHLDILSMDSNFYCKYFLWGQELLQLPSIAPSAIKVASNPPVLDVVPSNAESKPISPSTSLSEVPPVKNVQVKEDASGPDTAIVEEPPKIDTAKSVSPGKPTESSKPPASSTVEKNEKPVDKNTAAENNVEEPEETQLDPASDIDVEKGILEEEPVKKEETKEEQPNTENKGVIDNPKTKFSEQDDYQDPDDSKDGLPDAMGDEDGDDPSVGDLNAKEDQSKTIPKRIEPSVSQYNGEMSQRGFYPNSNQDDFPESDDDNFFPFFLTAVVLVVLLYVLYHNKSKVSKVVLGLIVEGRGSQRRGSRGGHAYRRLDTLEHAMTSASSAPPSKIIY